jgi:hypothetical protein
MLSMYIGKEKDSHESSPSLSKTIFYNDDIVAFAPLMISEVKEPTAPVDAEVDNSRNGSSKRVDLHHSHGRWGSSRD